MRTARLGWTIAAVAGVLTSCTATVEGTASPGGPPDLGAALSVQLPGLRPAGPPPPPPWQLCATAVGTPAPLLDPALGDPVAVGRTSGDATLHVYAWATSAPMVADAILDQAEMEAPDCASSPPSTEDVAARSVDEWAGSGWTGVSIRTEAPGPEPGFRETRLVHFDEVVVLVVLTTEGRGPDVLPVVDEYLAEVADRLR
ncbi:hypothetical protein [Geodermatophilus sp. DF01-2]|uniref:hypothetical protein n=1 Tax=Geodermatophilus sp. DF01-2 TaxID=2559610 RepID=UPI001431884B|nr:hypothetical protein [Geodermatophilus sp. DF01_2]